MRIVVIILCALLLACIGGAAFFYTQMYQPLDVRMKISIPEFDKTKAELAKYKAKEKMETAWINPMLDALNAELSDSIKAGVAEVLSTGSTLVVNISEQALYIPGSRTFAKESPRLLLKLEPLLRNDLIKGKDIYIGNTTEKVPAQTRGKIKTPQKDARTLAAERSMELIKYLEKKGMKPDVLIAAAYSSSQQTIGVKIKDRKTVITIETPPIASILGTKPVSAPEARSKPTATAIRSTTVTSVTPTASPAPKVQSGQTSTVTTKPSTTAASAATTTAPAPQSRPKPIPIRPAGPKTN